MKGKNVRPITDLKNRTKELVQEVSESGETVVITQNGTPRVVVMDIRRHDQLQDTLAMLKLLAQSQDSLAKGEKTYSTAEVRRRAQAALRRFQEQ
jgi:prevent-host-death family protein